MKNDYEQLFLRFREAGDMRALAKVFDGTAPELRAVAAHLAAHRDEADDLLQATFLTAIERASSYEAQRPLLPWLLGILALHARKLREKNGRVVDAQRVAKPAEFDPERAAAEEELRHAVEIACRELPPTYAELVRRHLAHGAPAGELATELGLSSGAARVRLHRGLKLLRRAIPAAFAGGAYAATGWRGLARVRGLVLERASAITGAPIPSASGLAAAAVVAACLAPLAIGLPAWIAWRAEEDPTLESTYAAVAPPSATELTADELDSAGFTTDSLDAREPTAPAPANEAQLQGAAELAIVRGRVLMPDHTPASGAQVRLDGSPANAERVQEFGQPADWQDPAPVQTSSDGRFEIRCEPPRAFQFSLDVETPFAPRVQWRWSELAAGSVTELGDIVLEPAASLVARIRDAAGNPLCTDWTVYIDAPALASSDGRETFYRDGRCSDGNGDIVVDRVPARRVKVSAASRAGATVDARLVELVPNECKQVELVYAGPDLSRRITIVATTRPFHPLRPDASAVRVSKPGMEARVAERAPRRANDYVVDGLEPGAYEVVIDDPRFVTWTASAVQPGAIVRAQLVGNAAIRLSIVDEQGQPHTGSFAASLSFLNANFSPNRFALVDPTKPPPAGNLLTGLVPGDFGLTVEVPGHPPRELQVLGLAANETRDVTFVLDPGRALAVRVLATDGLTPLSGTDVQITRGEIAGHTRAKSLSMWANGSLIPSLDARATTDALGGVNFSGLAEGTWTLRASWGRYLAIDRTLLLDATTPSIDLVQPPSGFLAGRLLLPEGAPLDDARLTVHCEAPATPWPDVEMGRDTSELFDDATFRLGPLPVGQARLGLQVRTLQPDGSTSAGGQSLGSFSILAGQETQAEIDLRERFPGRLRARVLIDGAVASGGFVELLRVNGEPDFGIDGGGVSIDGLALLGCVQPAAYRVTYGADDDRWAWCAPQTVTIEPARDSELEMVITTVERVLRVVELGTNAPLAQTDVAWRTGSPGREREARATTDANGELHLRMPEQNVDVRCVGDQGPWTTIAWSPGAAALTVVLRRAQ